MSLIKAIYLRFRALLSALALGPIAIWRIKGLRYGVVILAIFAAVGWYLFYGKLLKPNVLANVEWLEQGWTADQREKYYATDQGTLIVPYNWFVSLEMPPNPYNLHQNFEPFLSDENVSSYRLLPDRSKYNPDNMPVGLAKAIVADDVLDLGLGHKEWLSFSCAACHTGQFTYNGKGIRIDGMPAMWNFSLFGQTMTATLVTTRALPTKFDRFAKKVLALEGRPNSREERDKLRSEVDVYLKWPLITEAVDTTFERTYPTEEGPGRTDALGRGGNGQFAQLSKSNVRTGDGPVSFPPLWYTHDYDWVQSTTGIRQPLGRNVTESWGVNAIVDTMNADPNKLFRSTHTLDTLFWMETLLSVLEHPRWPENTLPKIDESLAEQGQYLYEEAVWENPRDPRAELYCGETEGVHCNEERISKQKGYCARCHSPVREPAPNPLPSPQPCDPTTDANCPANAPVFQLPLYRLDVMGTDPKDARNFNARVDTLSYGTGTFKTVWLQSEFKDQKFGIGNGLQFITTNVMNGWFAKNQALMDSWVADGVFPNVLLGRRIMEGFRQNLFRAPLAYPARPMAGYWATGPFLHNGSIPNLYELLSPVPERSTFFYIGNTEFDPVKVGFVSTYFRGAFQFVTNKAGNSMAGHEFSWKKGDPAKPGVIGPLLDHRERMAIVEYMKKISDVPPLAPQEAARRRELLRKMYPYYEGNPNTGYRKDLPKSGSY